MSNNETTKMPPKMKGPGPMGGPRRGHGPAEKAKDIKGTTKKLAGLLSKYKIIVLIDDIYTTGRTMDAVSKELKKAGVEEIYFLCISIGAGC